MSVSSTSGVAARLREGQNILARIRDAAIAHPLLTIFIVALVVRVFVAVVLTKYFSGTLVLDDTTYHQMAAQMAAGETSSWDSFTYELYWSTAAFMLPITVLYKLFGPIALVGQLFVVLIGTFTAVFVTRLVLEFLAPVWALLTGLIVALLPSQAFWSSMLMKDASVWFVLAGLGAVVAVGSRATGKQLIFLGALASGLMLMLSYLRLHTLVVAAWALMIAAFVGVREQRLPRIAGALAIGIFIPWLAGAIGPAGLSIVANHGSLVERRFLNAQGANTAIVSTLSERGAQERGAGEGIGAGSGRRLRPGARPGEGPTLEANLAHLPKGLLVMLLEPFPLPFSGSISLKLARLESLLWYPLLFFAAIGLWVGRRYPRQLMFPILCGGGIVIMYALSEGNVGTAHRHRGEFVWVVALLAALGFSYFASRRSTSASTTGN